MSDILDKIKALVKNIPQSPGVYQMKDETENIIYIGKAKNLKHRVAQYFGAQEKSEKTKKMVEKIVDVDVIETNNELEALMLETNLIKQYRPKYNILMRDDKNYVYIKVSTHEDYPRLSIVRKREQDRSLYFGPKTSADSCEKLINLLRKIFPIRTCTLEMEDGPDGLIRITKKTIPVPCLDYHIKRCRAPCIDLIKKDEYQDLIKQIVRFLKGNYQDLITRLKYQMFNSAKDKKFETAARIRDQIKGIEEMFVKQVVSDPEFFNRDVIGLFSDFDKTFITLFQFREGKLINQEQFILDTPQAVSTGSSQEQSSSVIESFLRSYYSEATDIPPEIFLRDEPLDQDLWKEWLTSKRLELLAPDEKDRKHVHLIHPERGSKHKILLLAEKNAATFARQSRAKWMSDAQKTTEACKDLALELGLHKELRRIECYDISHMGGEENTASMVVFIKGAPDKKLYRHFKLKSLEVGEIDDYKALEEVLTRRFQRLKTFSTGLSEHYEFKKPLKKDFETILQISGNVKLDSKDFIALYHGEKSFMGYTQLIRHDQGTSFGNTWIEAEHDKRALRHQLWMHALEKAETTHVYSVCTREEKEDFLSFGFTELKTVPDFLSSRGENLENPEFLIYKISKKISADQSFSDLPGLILVDGGKGQLSAALKALKKFQLEIPMAALAKEEEELFLEDRRILLPRNSQALYLVQRIRDESHRFANELRKKVGAKKLTESDIDSIPGIGTMIKRRLLKEYGSINGIKAASLESLEKTVGKYIAKMLKERFR